MAVNDFAGGIERRLTILFHRGAALRIQAAAVKLHDLRLQARVGGDDLAFHERDYTLFRAARMQQHIGQLQIHGRGKWREIQRIASVIQSARRVA